jgi:hypothetical protein
MALRRPSFFNFLKKTPMEETIENIYRKPKRMKIYLKTPLKSIGRREIGRIASMTMTWCKKNMGINNRKAYKPIWSLSAVIDDGSIVGDYDHIENEILIYYKNVEDVRELIATCIHEWQHQLQPCRSKYNKFKGSYNKHPMEIEAYNAEKLHLSNCWKGIRDKVNCG